MKDSALAAAQAAARQALAEGAVPTVAAFFDAETSSISYVVSDPRTSDCAVIDSVLGFDPVSGRTSSQGFDALARHVREQGLTVRWLLETHIHADHLSAAHRLKAMFGGTVGIGAGVARVGAHFGPILGEEGTPSSAAAFDHLFEDGETFMIGGLTARVLATPGHTQADVAYLIGDAAFIGDTLFMPDYGTARADFPGGDPRVLYRSIRRLLSLPDATRLFTGHDYKAPGRDTYAWESTVGAQRAGNVHVRDGIDEDAFVAFRTTRDATLSLPRLIWPSLQVNLAGGRLPAAEPNGARYLKIPLDAI